MTTSVRSKTTITFCLKKMVILLKSWRGNIVVIGPKSWLVNLLRNMQIFLRNSWENFGNSSREIPRNWFWRTYHWKFPRISTNFVDIFSGFSAELLTRNSLELVTRNSLDRVMRIFSEWVTRNSSDLVP